MRFAEDAIIRKISQSQNLSTFSVLVDKNKKTANQGDYISYNGKTMVRHWWSHT